MDQPNTVSVFALSGAWKMVIYMLLSILMVVFVSLAIGAFIDPSLKHFVVFILPVLVVMIR